MYFMPTMADEDQATTVAFTGRQKLALMLEKAKYPHREIARRMGLKNKESATRLLIRARRAQRAAQANAHEILGV